MELEDYTNQDPDFNQLLEEKRHKELLETLKSSLEVEDDFQKLLEDKRHKEIILVLKEILLSLSNINSQETGYNTETIEKILKEVALNKPQDDLPKSILTLGKIIEDKLSTINAREQATNWEFIIHRDHRDLISKVDAIKK